MSSEIRAQARRHLDAIDRATTKIVVASSEIETAREELSKIQKICNHGWSFTRQVNNYHTERWNVFYHCSECQKERVVKDTTPVCRVCDSPLQRTAENDKEAEQEKQKHQELFDWPVSFRCSSSSCRTVHILGILGD